MTCFISKSTGMRYDSDFHSSAQIPEDVVEISAVHLLEITAGLNAGKKIAWDGDVPVLEDAPPPSDAELRAALKGRCDHAIARSQAVVDRHRDEVDTGGATTLSADNFKTLLAYRAALRDLPAKAKNPTKANLPDPPPFAE